MKKYLIYIAFIVFSGFVFSSCDDMFGDFLDKAPGADLTEDEVFSDWKKSEYYFFDIYNFLPTGLSYINNSWLDAATDLGTTSYSWGGVRNSLNLGNYYGGGAAPEVQDVWYNYYKGIRKVNIYLAKVDGIPLASNETRAERNDTVSNLKAEARFLRAYFYWELVLRYGPVPIITKQLDPNDPDLNKIERPAKIDTCINFILAELDSSYLKLNNDTNIARKISQSGRATKGMALGLKSRILLYLASERYNPDNDINKWQKAMDAANEFITVLGHKAPKPAYMLMPYSDYSLVINKSAYENNFEIIFWRKNGKGDWWRNESPVSFGGYGGLCPSQNLVDMFDMKDGKSPFTSYDETGSPIYSDESTGTPSGINAVSGYNDQDPYINRDPRLKSNILYNGVLWWNQTINTYEGGKDKPVGNSDATPTSYYSRKYHDDSQTDYLNSNAVMSRNWVIIRYAEILLNYAEALNEVSGPVADVYNSLQLVRSRAGITGSLLTDRPGMTKEEMRNFIRKERTVELCFEGHRWWDVRRWNVADKALARPIYGMKIVKSESDLSFTRIKVQNRSFLEKMYLYPIPESEIWKTGMQNNPGWE